MATTWSGTNKATQSLLSNGSLTATGDGTNSDFGGQATASISGSQKIYFETSADVVVTTHPGFGFGNASQNFNSFLGTDVNSIGYFTNGQVFFNGGLLTTIGSYTTAAIVGSAIDFANAHCWWTLDGATWNSAILALQNPVGNVGGVALSVGGTVFPAYNLLTTAATTANFGATTFTYSTLFATLQAAGYSSFDSGDILMSQAVM